MLRDTSPDELRLLDFLVSAARGVKVRDDWRERLKVADLQDGGMGSLRIFPDGLDSDGRIFGRMASDYRFLDEDGVEVIVSLYLDQDEGLFELDSWKTDFGKLIRIPNRLP